MLLNKLPVLDKGYVAYLDSSGNIDLLKDVALEFFNKTDGKFLTDIGMLTVAIKCPLFVQCNLSTFNLKIIVTAAQAADAYIPNVGEIGAPDHETSRVIADDLMRTSEALLINPTAYQHDGADRFISQVIMPVSTYTTLIVHGSYNDWRAFCNQANLPGPIRAYADAVNQIMKMEWR